MEYKIVRTSEKGSVYYTDIDLELNYPFRYQVERDNLVVSSLVTSNFQGGVITTHGETLKFIFVGKFLSPNEKAIFVTADETIFCTLNVKTKGFWQPETIFTIDFNSDIPQLCLKKVSTKGTPFRYAYSAHCLYHGQHQVAKVVMYNEKRRMISGFNSDKLGVFECESDLNELQVSCILALVHVSDYLDSIGD